MEDNVCLDENVSAIMWTSGLWGPHLWARILNCLLRRSWAAAEEQLKGLIWSPQEQRNILSGDFSQLGRTCSCLLCPILGPMRTSQDFDMNEISFLEKTNFPTAFPVTTWAHLKGDAGFFVEVDLSDDSSCFLLHIKDAAAVGRPGQVHSVADKAGWGTLEGDEEVGRTRAVCLSPFQRQ